MDVPNQTIADKTTRSATKKPPYRVYAFLLAMIFVARIFALVTQDMEWTIGVYSSPIWFRVFLTLSVVLSLASGFYFKRHLPALITWMSCGLVGGICMLLINSIPGVIIGLCVGAVIVRHDLFSATLLSYFGKTIVPSGCLGFATGCGIGFVWFNWGAQRPGTAEWLSIALTACAGMILSCIVLRFIYRRRRWYGWGGALILFLMLSFVGVFRHISWELDRIERGVSSAGSVICGSGGLSSMLWYVRPFPNQKLFERCQNIERIIHRYSGYRFDWVKDIQLDKDSSHIGIELASRFPFVQSMVVAEGCPITDAEFRAFNLRHLLYLRIEPGTQLTADALRDVDLPKLQVLSLSGQNIHVDLPELETLEFSGHNIDDDLLASIGATPNLQSLTLENTSVTAEGLKQFASAGRPITKLDVGSHALPNEFFENKNLNLTHCTLDGLSVDPANIQLYGSLQLALHFDAQMTAPAEIVSHVEAVRDAQFEQLKQTAKRMGLPIPTRQKWNFSVIVDRLKLTDQALTTLEPVETYHYLELTNAIGPDGKVVLARGVSHARAILNE